MWSLLSSSDAHPILQAALGIGVWLRLLALPPLVMMLVFYEKYHHWGSSSRWERGNSLLEVSKAKHLGKRPTLVSIRSSWWLLTDWLYIPVSGILFLTSPQLHAHIFQLFTNKLDYKVAAKPILEMRPVSQIESVPLSTVTVESDNEDGSARSNQFFDANSSVSHGDSGFFEFEIDGTMSNNSPGKKKNFPVRHSKTNRPADIVEDRTSWTGSV